MKLLIQTLLVLCGFLNLTAFVNGGEKPNIVLIISDDHAWTDYGFMGHPKIQTPHLDRLAKDSLTFPRGYVPSSLCCPSLASIISGRYPHEHKVTSNDPPMPEGMNRADFQKSSAFAEGRETMSGYMDSIPTLPRLLTQQGYRSFQSGKWWQGDFRRGGFTHGMTQGGRHGDAGLDIGRKSMNPIYEFIDESVQAKQPFLVWYAPLLPHDPHTPPERLLEKYRKQTPSIHIARYWAMVEWFDETIGELRSELESRGLTKNTILVYVSDNGWIQNSDNPRYAPRSKQSPYEAGLRTPIMISWPGRLQPEMIDIPITSLDLLPTLLSLTKSQFPADLPGLDLGSAALRSRKAIFGNCFTHNAVDLSRPETSLRWRWMISEGYKLIVPHPKNEPNAPVELFHLETDPTELTNLAEKQPERLTALKAQLDAWWNP